MIPKIIHQTWKTKNIPESWQGFVQSWKDNHPQWQYRLWSNQDGFIFVQKEYPEFYNTYCNLSYDIQRADAIRYLVVHKFGGLYVDLDYECLQPFDEFLDEPRLTIGLEPKEHATHHGEESLLCNALFAAQPGNPFLLSMMENIQSAPTAITHKDVLSSTGPQMMQRTFEQHGDKWLRVFSAEKFCPLAANSPVLEALISGTPDAAKIKQGLRHRGSYAIHYWANSWVGTLSGELDNPTPSSIDGFKFYQGLDSSNNDLFNGGRDINMLANKCRNDDRVVAFNTDGFAKFVVRDSSQWRTMNGAAENEGLYVKLN